MYSERDELILMLDEMSRSRALGSRAADALKLLLSLEVRRMNGDVNEKIYGSREEMLRCQEQKPQ